MSNIVTDTFTDTSGTFLQAHTGETGATWTKHTLYAGQNATIGSGNSIYGGGSYGLYYASGTPTNADYNVSASITFGATVNPNGGLYGVAGRINTTTGACYAAEYGFGFGAWIMWRVDSVAGQ